MSQVSRKWQEKKRVVHNFLSLFLRKHHTITHRLIAARGAVTEAPAAALGSLDLGNRDDVDGDSIELEGRRERES